MKNYISSILIASNYRYFTKPKMSIVFVGKGFRTSVNQTVATINHGFYGYIQDKVKAIYFTGRCKPDFDVELFTNLISSLSECKELTINRQYMNALSASVNRDQPAHTADNIRRLEVTGIKQSGIPERERRAISRYFPYVSMCATAHGAINIRTGEFVTHWSAAYGYIRPASTEAVFIAIANIVLDLPLHLAYMICEHVRIDNNEFELDPPGANSPASSGSSARTQSEQGASSHTDETSSDDDIWTLSGDDGEAPESSTTSESE